MLHLTLQELNASVMTQPASPRPTEELNSGDNSIAETNADVMESLTVSQDDDEATIQEKILQVDGNNSSDNESGVEGNEEVVPTTEKLVGAQKRKTKKQLPLRRVVSYGKVTKFNKSPPEKMRDKRPCRDLTEPAARTSASPVIIYSSSSEESVNMDRHSAETSPSVTSKKLRKTADRSKVKGALKHKRNVHFSHSETSSENESSKPLKKPGPRILFDNRPSNIT